MEPPVESVSARDTAAGDGDDRPAVDAPAPHALERSSRRREVQAIAALALAAFSLNLNTNVLGALLPFVRAEVGGAGGPLLAAAGFGSAVGALLCDRLARRIGRRSALVVGLAGFVAASALHVVPGSAAWLIALRAAAGAAVGLAYAAASALVAELAPYGRRGAAMGRFNAGMFLAIPVGMPLSVWFASLGYWPGVFALQAVVGLLGCYWTLRAVPVDAPAPTGASTWRVLANGGAMAGLFATALHVGSFFTTVQLATTWLDRTGRLPKDQQMPLWIGLGLLSVLGSSLLGRTADAVGKRLFVMVTSLLLAACFWLLAREQDGLTLALVGSVLALVASARTGPLQALVSGQVPAGDLAALMGLRGFLMQVGVGGFALAAAVLERERSFAAVLWLAVGFQALSYLAIRLFVREGK